MDAAPSREQLLRILLIAREHSGPRGHRGTRGLSLRDLMEESAYRDHRPGIEPSRLASILRGEPPLIDDWLWYSLNKQTHLGWGFGETGRESWLIDGPGDVREEYASAPAACAEYALRELDFWDAVARSKASQSEP